MDYAAYLDAFKAELANPTPRRVKNTESNDFDSSIRPLEALIRYLEHLHEQGDQMLRNRLIKKQLSNSKLLR